MVRVKSQMYCRSFYIRSDGTMYLQAGHDKVSTAFSDTLGKRIIIPIAGNRTIIGTHTETKKCGIVLTDWNITIVG